MQDFRGGEKLDDFNVVLDSSSFYPATFGAGGNRGIEDGTGANKRYPEWAQVEGAGTIVYVCEDGTTVTRPCSGGEIIRGVIKRVTSMGATRLILGVGDPPPPSPAASVADLYADALSTNGIIELPWSTFYLLTGAPLAVFSNGASAVPGSALVDSKASGIRWNDHATPNAIMRSFLMPPDCDITANATLHIRASKIGATVGDAVTFDVGLFNQVDGALHDADSDFGGTSSAMTGDATSKTVQNVTLTLALANLAAFPASVTITIKPTAGTLGTDDLLFEYAYIVYKKKLTS